jgi:mannose-6-phosphate isomerase
MFDEPISFQPLFMERVWGGRRLEEAYAKALPPGARVGESWELVDREEAQSLVVGGEGLSLHHLWRDRRPEVFGARGAATGAPRFPILVKFLDAVHTLSVQVHPPATVAPQLGGEPKNELWVLAAARPGAHLYVGLRSGVTKAAFEAALEGGTDVSAMLHRVDVEAGDAMYIPSGRVHAIGEGCLIAEIQQNSDTTYRVFDFHRRGLDGRPRDLHVPASLRSIDFDDVEPSLAPRDGEEVAHTPFFEVERWTLDSGTARPAAPAGEAAIVLVLEGEVGCGRQRFAPGALFLAPAAAELSLTGDGAQVLRILLATAERAAGGSDDASRA